MDYMVIWRDATENHRLESREGVRAVYIVRIPMPKYIRNFAWVYIVCTYTIGRYLYSWETCMGIV
jgi:hypothetical protein